MGRHVPRLRFLSIVLSDEELLMQLVVNVTYGIAIAVVALMWPWLMSRISRLRKSSRCKSMQITSSKTSAPVPNGPSSGAMTTKKSDSSRTMDKAIQPALAGKAVHYERRRPEETALHQLVQEHLETFFFAQVELETGAGLPDFVKEEFDAFLECGILV